MNEYEKRIIDDKLFRSTDEKGVGLSDEERDKYLSIINSCPFIVESNNEIVQMFTHKINKSRVGFNGMIAWNNEKNGGFCVDGVIDFKNEIIEIRFAMENKDFGKSEIINFADLKCEKRKVL